MFPKHEMNMFYDFGEPDDQEWLIDEIITHYWNGRKLEFLVKWNLGDETWEPFESCKELEALDKYLELKGLKDDEWNKLPRSGSTTTRTERKSSVTTREMT